MCSSNMCAARHYDYRIRYIVGIRGITNGSALVAPSVAFHDLRDNVSSSDWDIEGRRALFADIFSRLGGAGVPRSDLQLAWCVRVGCPLRRSGGRRVRRLTGTSQPSRGT